MSIPDENLIRATKFSNTVDELCIFPRTLLLRAIHILYVLCAKKSVLMATLK